MDSHKCPFKNVGPAVVESVGRIIAATYNNEHLAKYNGCCESLAIEALRLFCDTYDKDDSRESVNENSV
jgi:hypothetical protein